jgi:hypothetical protein
VSKYLTIASLLAITLNCPARADQPGKFGKPLTLADLWAWEQANQKSLDDARKSGNPLAQPAVEKQIADDLKKWAGKPVEGKATISYIFLDKEGNVFLSLTEGVKRNRGVSAKVADPKDPLLPKLRVGQEIVIRGTFTIHEGSKEEPFHRWGVDNVKVTLP